jgi:lysophospholipase L1-like esterase
MPFSICIFGDSVCKGVVFDSARKKYQFLKDNFAAMFSRVTGISVSNYSTFGSTLPKGEKTVERHLGELHDFDSILLEFGGNDCDFNWKEVSERPEVIHLPNTPFEAFSEQYREMICTVRQKGGKPILLTLPPLDAERYFRWVSAGLDGGNILKWLGDVNRIYRWQEYYNMAVCRVAAELHAPLLDIRSAFLEQRDYNALLCEDGIHPNEKGHKLISSVLTERLPALLGCKQDLALSLS